MHLQGFHSLTFDLKYLLLEGLYARVSIPLLHFQLRVQQTQFPPQFTPFALQAIQRLHQPVDASLCPLVTAGFAFRTQTRSGNQSINQ